MKTLELSAEKIDLVIVALRATAAVSREYGHHKQADEFSCLADEIQDQATKTDLVIEE